MQNPKTQVFNCMGFKNSLRQPNFLPTSCLSLPWTERTPKKAIIVVASVLVFVHLCTISSGNTQLCQGHPQMGIASDLQMAFTSVVRHVNAVVFCSVLIYFIVESKVQAQTPAHPGMRMDLSSPPSASSRL